jgi:hypothetical protein
MNKKESHWFSHDQDVMLDPKITLLMAEYDFAGYGRWWHMVELLRGSKDYRYCISEKYTYHILSQKLHTTIDQARKFIADLIDFNLFQTDGEYIWSDSLLARMEYWNKRRKVLSENGKKGAAIKHGKDLATPQESDSPANNLPPVFLANETILNNTKQDDTISNDTKGLNDADDNIGKSILNTSTNNTNSSPANEAYWQQQKTTILADVNFTEPHLASGALTVDKLAAWLDAFNRTLIYNGEPSKPQSEYRRHFTNWFKYRDLWREEPLQFSPTNKTKPQQQEINPLGYLKTPAQIRADEERHREEWKKRRLEEQGKPQTPKGASLG